MAIMNGFSSTYISKFHEIFTGDQAYALYYPDPWYSRLSSTTFDTDMGGIAPPTAASYEDSLFDHPGSPRFHVYALTPGWRAYTLYDWEFTVALEDWGTVTAFCVYSVVATVERPLYGGPLTTPVEINKGSTVVFLSGQTTMRIEFV